MTRSWDAIRLAEDDRLAVTCHVTSIQNARPWYLGRNAFGVGNETALE